jgi:zinc transport system ATP-binding protein
MKPMIEEKIILEVNKVSFSFNETKVLSDISFKLNKGDFLGLIGPNGSGKTTLLKLILGIYSLKEGSIKILNKNISTFSDWHKLGYVPQKATNIETEFPATVHEVVAMGLLSKKKFPKIISRGDNNKIMKTLELVKMTQYSNRRIGQLSGGQQQRVLIAKSLVSNPEILFLDEPTTGIDQESQKTFYELLGNLNKKGITIVLVSHDIGKITNFVNKIASINQRLEFYGTHKDFCAYDINHKHDTHNHNLCLDRG